MGRRGPNADSRHRVDSSDACVRILKSLMSTRSACFRSGASGSLPALHSFRRLASHAQGKG